VVKVNKDIWFKAKTYGWGWGLPLKWQGWLVYFLYFFIVLFPVFIPEIRMYLDKNDRNSLLYILYLILPTIILIYICYMKGEKPRWRWGR